jgi:hypothetical protein
LWQKRPEKRLKLEKTAFRWENNMMVVLKDVGSDWIHQT